MGGIAYQPYPINSGVIDVDSSGKIGETTITLSNFDNIITDIIENPYLVGFNTNTSISINAVVNGETVRNIDARTVPSNVQFFTQTVVDERGGTNLAFDYRSTIATGSEWEPLKADTRDLLGAVVEIKSTFANFLDVWPEHSISTGRSNVGLYLPMRSTLPYRVGDLLTNNFAGTGNTYTINSISATGFIIDSPAVGLEDTFYGGSPVYIINADKDEDSYSLDRFKVDGLSSSDERVSVFNLTNWLQYFKLQLPKRKFYKNTCTWVYKGPECGYPESGTGNISNSTLTFIKRTTNTSTTVVTDSIVTTAPRTANGFFNIRNEPVDGVVFDVCAKNVDACKIRNNSLHFGGFPGTGRNIPR